MKKYIFLTKPGIIFGNLITMFAGFVLGSSHHSIDWKTFLAAALGLSSIIASACICNNAIDRKIDAKMLRTQNRSIAVGHVSVYEAVYLAAAIGLTGIFILGAFVNLISLISALAGFLIYVALYSTLKPQTHHATLIGSFAGAVPPLVGYAAAANQLNFEAFLLFLIVLFWQMPHFFAIAIYRIDDYSAANIPVLPLAKGMKTTKIQTVFYALCFFIASLAPFFLNYTGSIYLVVATLIGSYWLCVCIQGFWTNNDQIWAKKIFRISLIAITSISIAILF